MRKKALQSLDLVLPERLPSPRRSLRSKAIVVVTGLALIPTVLCGVLMHRRASVAMRQTLLRDSALLAETTSELFASQLEGGGTKRGLRLSRTIDQLVRDQRVAFLVAMDPEMRVIAHRYNEPVAWHTYERQLTPSERLAPLTLNRSIPLRGAGGELLVVRRQLIRRAASGGGMGEILGHLELGLHDPRQAQMLRDLRDDAVVMVGLICLALIPAVVLWVRHWTGPLRRMLEQTQRLSAGEKVGPMDVDRDDEIGLLARSLSAMGENLSSVQGALIESNAELERKVAERTRQLEESNRRLEREMRDKDQFLRAVTHDLSAPLRNIAGLTQRLLLKHRDEMDAEIVSKLDRISANVRAESELIRDLLELSRISRRSGRCRPVDLNQLVRAIGEQLGYDLERKGITLTMDGPLPTVSAERSRMHQLFQNLIDNAIKYMPANAAERRVHVGWKTIEARRAFYVRDTGAGIAAEDQATIFQVFRRGRYSVHSPAGGRGVGLASVKAIVDSYGGTVWVRSRPPDGATFYFTLGSRYIVDDDANDPEATRVAEAIEG